MKIGSKSQPGPEHEKEQKHAKKTAKLGSGYPWKDGMYIRKLPIFPWSNGPARTAHAMLVALQAIRSQERAKARAAEFRHRERSEEKALGTGLIL